MVFTSSPDRAGDDRDDAAPAAFRRAGPVIATLPRPRSADPVTVGVLGDPHLTPSASGTWKVYHRTEERFRTAIDDVRVRDPDAVVFAGDLTKDGSSEAFDRFDALVEDCPVPWFAIPGNHDVPKSYDDTDGLGPARFARRYADGPYPVVWQCGDVTLVGLNSAAAEDGSLAGTWGGAVSTRELDRLDSVLGTARSPIVIVHHNCSSLVESADSRPWRRFRLRNADRLREVCDRNDVSLVVSAHHHVPAAVEGTGPTELIAPAVCSFPNAYLLLRVSSHGTVARMVPLAGPEGMAESYAAARSGSTLGRGILSLVLDEFPSSRNGLAGP